jgi:hypothetical protein
MLSTFLATRNSDKCSILQTLLSSFVPDQLIFSTPMTEECNNEVEEEGSVLSRARCKAKSHCVCCGSNKDLIVGSDDAFRIPDYFEDKVLCDSKQVTQMLLSGGVTVGTAVILVRSFWFIDKRRHCKLVEIENGCLTEIPFSFLGSSMVDSYLPNIYPLSNVLGRINGTIPVALEEASLMNGYYVSHSLRLKTTLIELLNLPQRNCFES